MKNRKKKSKGNFFPGLKIVFILLIVLGIGLFIQGVRTKIAIDHRIEGYESVEGYYWNRELYSEAKRIGRQHKNATYAHIYVYYVDDVEYTVKTDYGTEAEPEIGSPKTIWYNPENPEEAIISGTNRGTILIVMGLFFTLIPTAMMLIVAAADGKLGRFSFNITDIVLGLVMFVLGLGILYVIAGQFSGIEVFKYVGPFCLIPVMFLVVGVHLVWRGVRGRTSDMTEEKK